MKDNDKNDAHEEMLHELFQHALPRPQPAEEAREAAYSTLHDEWLELTARRRRHRRLVTWGLAASVAIAALLGFRTLDTGDTLSFEPVAIVARVSGGNVVANNSVIDSPANSSAAVSLFPGDSLKTGSESFVAISWGAGGSLRLDQNSEIEFLSDDVVRLAAGSVYFDSRQFGQTSNPDLRFSVDTPYGRVTHVGTQFMLHMEPDQLSVAVREGEVTVDGTRFNVAVHSGDEKILFSNGRFDQKSINASDPRWTWVADIAPEVQLDGRTVREILDWIGRESGRSVLYSAEAKQHAETIKLIGIGRLDPQQALRTIPVMTDLRTTLRDDRIIVEF